MKVLDQLASTLPRVGRRSLRGFRRSIVALLVNSVLFVLSLLWFLPLGEVDEEVALGLGVIGLFVHPILAVGLGVTGLLAARGAGAGVATLVGAFWPPSRWVANLIVAALLAALVGAGVVLLVLPGLLVLARLSFSIYYVNHLSLSPLAAMRESWRLTQGRTALVLVLTLLSFGLLVGGFVVYVVGAIPVLAFLVVAWAVLFDVLREDQAKAEGRAAESGGGAAPAA